MSENTYKIKAPIGNITVPSDEMKESSIKHYAHQIATTTKVRDEIKKGKVDVAIEYLRKLGYKIEQK